MEIIVVHFKIETTFFYSGLSNSNWAYELTNVSCNHLPDTLDVDVKKPEVKQRTGPKTDVNKSDGWVEPAEEKTEEIEEEEEEKEIEEDKIDEVVNEFLSNIELECEDAEPEEGTQTADEMDISDTETDEGKIQESDATKGNDPGRQQLSMEGNDILLIFGGLNDQKLFL